MVCTIQTGVGEAFFDLPFTVDAGVARFAGTVVAVILRRAGSTILAGVLLTRGGTALTVPSSKSCGALALVV